MLERLRDAALTTEMARLVGWALSVDGLAIEKEFRFSDFVGAMGFMTKVSLLAEKADHHPEWSNVWNKVNIRLTTHDAQGVSLRDIKLALAIDGLHPAASTN